MNFSIPADTNGSICYQLPEDQDQVGIFFKKNISLSTSKSCASTVHIATMCNVYISQSMSIEADECNSTKQACPSSDFVTLVMNKYFSEYLEVSQDLTMLHSPE